MNQREHFMCKQSNSGIKIAGFRWGTRDRAPSVWAEAGGRGRGQSLGEEGWGAGTVLEAWREIPVEAASDTMATSLRPSMKDWVSFTFRLSSSALSGLARSSYTPLHARCPEQHLVRPRCQLTDFDKPFEHGGGITEKPPANTSPHCLGNRMLKSMLAAI